MTNSVFKRACETCGLMVNSWDMADHIEKKHPKPANRYACPLCSEKLSFMEVDAHVMGKHRNLRAVDFQGSVWNRRTAWLERAAQVAKPFVGVFDIKICLCGQQILTLKVGERVLWLDFNDAGEVLCLHNHGEGLEGRGDGTSVHAYSGGAVDSNRRKH